MLGGSMRAERPTLMILNGSWLILYPEAQRKAIADKVIRSRIDHWFWLKRLNTRRYEDSVDEMLSDEDEFLHGVNLDPALSPETM